MKPSNKKNLSPQAKQLLLAQLNDYRRRLRQQLHVQQELLMLHMDLMPLLINQPAYASYVNRWAELIKSLPHGKPMGGNNE